MKKREFIVQDLLSKIYQEEFSAGKLPNQRTLAQTYGVSRFTIQQACLLYTSPEPTRPY